MTTTETLREVALSIESALHTEIGFNEPKAVLLSLSNVDTEVSWQVASRHGDVYQLLSSPEALLTAKASDAIGLVTCGWASPVSNTEMDDLPPSVHPGRRRVRIFVVADKATRRISVLRFQDQQDDVVVDESTARGDLADALSNLFTAGE